MTRIEIEWSENETIQSFEFNLIGNEKCSRAEWIDTNKTKISKKEPQYDMAFYASAAKPDSITTARWPLSA